MLSRLSRMRAGPTALICMTSLALMQFTSVAYAQKGARAEKSNPQAAAGAIEKKKKAHEIDDPYKSALKGIPDKPKTDPWGSMR